MQYNCVVTGQVIGRIRTQRAGLSGVARSHLALLEAGIKRTSVLMHFAESQQRSI